ncbi:MAG TPA: Maf family protein [Chiayiivirga sp.]|nr:Maf family protein [Chiayiivirga sp.]
MLYLASQSPRRAQLLTALGYAFSTCDIEVPEHPAPDEGPHEYVSRVALDKARAGFRTLDRVEGAVVLAADTEVVLGNDIFGKPDDAAAAQAMLERLSGRQHDVITVLWAIDAGGARSACCRTQVSFAVLNRVQIAEYIASGEPFGKAGAYAIQGRGGAFVESLTGSHSGVMGLPMFETDRLLRSFGLQPSAANVHG